MGASISPSASESKSISPSTSGSPSASSSKSRSPSSSRSPSASNSKSLSPSSSISPSSTKSASPSPSEAEVVTIETSAQNGVYTLGQHTTTYPMILDLTYPISERSGSDLVLNNIEIGSICIAGSDIFVSWYNHNKRTTGIDKIDWDNKLDGANFVTKLLPVYRIAHANYTSYFVSYCSLPEDTEIEMYYSTDYGQSYVALTVDDDTDRKIVSSDLTIEATNIMLKIVARTSINSGPVIEALGVGTS